MKPNRYMVFFSMGFELVGLILGSVFVGQKLDALWGTKGIALLVLTVACLAGWMVHLVYLLKRIEKLEAKDEQSKS